MATTDPLGNFNFKVEITGIVRASFREVSGLDATIDVIEYREGGDVLGLRKLPGITKYSNVVLKWGLADDDELYRWHRRAVEGDVERKDGSIVILDRLGEEKVRWNFFRAWPVKWDPADLNATGNELAIETLELAHEGLARA